MLSAFENLEYETLSRSAARHGRNMSKTRRRPRFSHSSPSRLKARSTTVAAQRTSNIRSADQLSDSCGEIEKGDDGASDIQSSQETNCTSPPRFRAERFACASRKKSSNALSTSERKRPRAGLARCRS